MSTILSKNKAKDEIAELDVSFILKFLGKLTNQPMEIKLIEFYGLMVNENRNTIALYKEFLYKKLQVTNDKELFAIVNKRLFIKNSMKIKAVMDSLIFLKYGSEVIDARFVSFITANKEKVLIKIEIIR